MRQIRKYWKDYKFDSLFFKNLVQIFMLITIPLGGLFLVLYFFFSSWKIKELESYSDKITQRYCNEWEKMIQACETEMFRIMNNERVKLFFYDKEMKQLNYKYDDIHEQISFPVLSREYIEDLFLYAGNGGYILNRSSILKYENADQKKYVELWYGKEQKNNLIYLEEYVAGYQRRKVALYSETVYGKLNGLCVMLLNVDKVSEELDIEEECRFYVTDGQTIYFSNDKTMIGRPETEIQGVDIKDIHSLKKKDKGILNYATVNGKEMKIITMIDEEDYFIKTDVLQYIIIAFGFFILLSSVLVAIRTSVKMYKPISEILYFLQNTEKDTKYGKYEVADEVGYILSAIRERVYFSEDIEKELQERMKLLKNAQIMALQAQINPHFINNTLDTINWMAIRRLGEKNEVSDTLQVLANVLKASREKIDTLITIEKEIAYCKDYLAIQRIRYEERFEVMWDVPPQIQERKIIPLVLQPIVENAICHGIEQLSEEGHISIRAFTCEGAVVFEIEDNGLGMGQKDLEDLIHTLQISVIKENEHIGLSNVNQRLKLWFGEEYGVSVESRRYVGTKVTLRIPEIVGK